MESFWYRLYNAVGVPFLYTGFCFVALVNSKVRRGIRGRKDFFKRLEEATSRLPEGGPRFWIHSSSMGEFEQAKPLIERLKERFPRGSVIVSFFSPSVFEHVQEYRGADHLCYLPFDSRKRAERFLSLVRPDVAIVVRHDFWPNHLRQLNRQGVPTVLINCSVHISHRFPLSLKIHQFFYSYFDLILTVSQEAKSVCETFRFEKGRVELVGDTRYDQVVRRAKEAEKIVEPLRKFKGRRRCFVVGSTWPSDEEILFGTLHRLLRERIDVWTVLVPHEPTKERLFQIERRLSSMELGFSRFSDLEAGGSCDGEVLVVDRVGILASLYALGELCFVGGGFGPGIHNVLEPAALGKVVLFGPRHKNSYEAGQLKKHGVGFVVRSGEELYSLLLSFLKDTGRLSEKGRMAADLVQENVGATERIVNRLEDLVR